MLSNRLGHSPYLARINISSPKNEAISLANVIPRRFLTSLFMGMWLYSLMLWGWITANYYLLPVYQFSPLSVYVPIPQNLLADIAFPVSFVCFVIWNYLRKR